MPRHDRVTLGLSIALALIAIGSAGYAQRPGDVVVCFEVAPAGGGKKANVDIFAQRLTPDGESVWNDGEPLAVADSPQAETRPATCGDGEGGVIVVYALEFTEGDHKGDVDIYAQRLDKNGKLLWNRGEESQPVATSEGYESRPVVVSDGQGGAIVVYEWVEEKGDTDILAQRIDGEGTALWNDGDQPSIVAASEAIERSPVAVPDGRGGVIVFFEWAGAGEDVDITAQRISADGKVLWNDGERAVEVSNTKMIERNIAAVPDGRGGAIAAFEVHFLDGKYKGDVDIMAQRISGDGIALWNDAEDPSVVSSGEGLERNPTAVPDGAGGILVAFEYEPIEGEYAGDTDVMAQRLDGDGNMVWNDGERSSTVSSSTNPETSPKSIPSGDGGAVIVFEHEFRDGEHAGDIDVFAQRLDSDGNMLWNDGERSSMVLGSEWLERSPVPVPDGRGGAFVVSAATGSSGKYKG
ncbi:MAG: hypothetical protein ACE5JM_15960, partial [Armatimonadota bacterium]